MYNPLIVEKLLELLFDQSVFFLYKSIPKAVAAVKRL